MKLILDTHVFIWWVTNPDKLSSRVFDELKNTHNDLFLSAVSIWEIVVKVRLGKLEIDGDLSEHVKGQVEQNGLLQLSLSPEHVYKLDALEDIHKDPFDRLLVAQSLYEGARLVTKDEHIQRYEVETIW